MSRTRPLTTDRRPQTRKASSEERPLTTDRRPPKEKIRNQMTENRHLAGATEVLWSVVGNGIVTLNGVPVINGLGQVEPGFPIEVVLDANYHLQKWKEEHDVDAVEFAINAFAPFAECAEGKDAWDSSKGCARFFTMRQVRIARQAREALIAFQNGVPVPIQKLQAARAVIQDANYHLLKWKEEHDVDAVEFAINALAPFAAKKTNGETPEVRAVLLTMLQIRNLYQAREALIAFQNSEV